jgi:hypothetical protein
MRRFGIVWITLSMPVLAALTQGSSCGPVTPLKMDLTVNKSGQGDVVCSPGEYSYDSGTVVTMTATAASGWVFDRWEGALSGSTNPTTLTMDADKTVTAVFVEASGGCVELTQTVFTTDTTIPAGCYLVNSSMRVRNNAVLTLSPGVTLQFGANLGLFVESDGALNAVGTAASPIALTGQTQSPGYWVGLRFDGSNSPDNVLQYVTVAYGGAASGSYTANLEVSGSSRVAISHSTLSDGSTLGFDFNSTLSDTPTITFDYNTVTRNHDGAGELVPLLVGALTTTSTFTGNTTDLVSVVGGNTSADQTWQAIGVDYVLEGSLRVDHHTTMAPGVHLVFKPGLGLFVQNTGALTAMGTAVSPILFTCQNKAAGVWVGVRFASNTPDNHLEYATVEYGGYDSGGLKADVLVDLNSSAIVDYCTIQYSSSYGIRKRSSGSLTQSNNTFFGNGATDVQLDP